jgi:hypothetical protein
MVLKKVSGKAQIIASTGYGDDLQQHGAFSQKHAPS